MGMLVYSYNGNMCLEVKKSAKGQEKNGNVGGRRKAGGRIAGIGHARF